MKRTTLRTGGSLATLALTLSLGLSACGGDDTAADSGTDAESSAPAEPTPEEPSSEPAAEGAAAQVFGEGCAAVPPDGDGSFDGMATEPVANAASANPLLKTLVAAVTKAGLVDTLNSAEDITVFAPTDDAFAKLPKKDLKAVLADKALLTQILTHHVVGGALTPETLAGDHDTLNKDTVTVEGSGDAFTVDAGGGNMANVICGNVPTANATVYIVDSVLMPS
ncbi:fasciclin domain-containing protein [Nocardioides sp. InS609-2]|uniref:fasciclin domain-containing protein n=1 Tax=Nocardioides sp. InS609-2 TaxID=2760705 RepID=UPI0020BEF753|nr:fasciclin domain-containing protein [Nocardioides sp. InS609-2]